MKSLWKIKLKNVKNNTFMKLIFNIQKNYTNFMMIYPFYRIEWELKKLENLLLIYMI